MVLALIRACEPFFVTFLQLNIRRVLCCRTKADPLIKEAEANLQKNNIVSNFIHTALNVEVLLSLTSSACAYDIEGAEQRDVGGECRDSDEEADIE
jgi:hypothetical protein